MKKIIIWFAIYWFWAIAALAIDPGRARGSLILNGEGIVLTHAFAELHDNAEGALEYSKELRILVVDRDVPQESLNGLMPLPIETMAKHGQVRGLLIRMNPDDPGTFTLRLLDASAESGESMMTLTRSSDVFKDFKVGGNRVGGEIQEAERGVGLGSVERMAYEANFSAPLFNEPVVTADLKGVAAQKSPQMAVLKAKIEAMAKADFAALQALSTARANAANAALMADPQAAQYYAKQGAAERRKRLSGLRRIVERGDHAVAIFADKSFMNFAKENGVWKADD